MKKTLFLVFVFRIIFSLNANAFTKQMWVGETYQCDITSAIIGIVSDVSWSSNGGYFSMSGSGFYRNLTITQYFSGTATVTCSWKYKLYSNDNWRTQSKSWTFSCNDNPCSITPANMTLSPKGTGYISYYFKYNNQYTSNANVYFSSSNPNVATVTNDGCVTAVGPGTTYITCYSKISSKSPYCTITVKEIPVTSISMPSFINIVAGESKQIFTEVTPSGASIKSKLWYSSDSSIVSVTSSGKLTGVKHGKAFVYCIVNNSVQSNKATVNVDKASLSLASDKNDGLIVKGSYITLTASNPNAKIYYTLDGTTPNENSQYYKQPISIDQSGTLKAIAILDGFYNSDILIKKYEVTSLKLLQCVPSNKETKISPDIIPTFIFNSNILKSEYFYNIIIKNNETQDVIESDIIVLGNKLQIVPKNYIPTGIYTVYIPENALKNINEEANFKYTLEFAVKEKLKSNILEMGDRYMLLEDGSLFVWGDKNNYPESYEETIPWIPIKISEDVKCAHLTSYYNYYVKNDDSLWGWNSCQGSDDIGYLGNGGLSITKEPVIIADEVKEFIKGEHHNGVIKNNGDLYLWGRNDWGQVGNGTTGRVLSPLKIMSDVVKFSAKSVESVALKNNGTLWGWGQTYIIDGERGKKTTPVQLMSNVKDFDHGSRYVLALKQDNSLWGFGLNEDGQIGNGMFSGTHYTKPVKILENVKKIYANFGTSVALTNNGILYRWGLFLHSGSISPSNKPIQIMENVIDVQLVANNIIALKNDSTLWICGSNENGMLGNGSIEDEYYTDFYSPIANVKKYWASDINIFVLKHDNSIWGWGNSLGTGSYEGSSTPIEIVPAYTYIPCKEVSIPKNMYLSKGEKIFIEMTLYPENADYESVEWSSENDSIASVNSRGLVCGHSEGSTVIRAILKTKEKIYNLSSTIIVNKETGNKNIFPNNRVEISIKGRKLFISGLKLNDTIFIYTASGILVYNKKITSTTQLEHDLPHSGIYIVKYNKGFIKVIGK